VALEIVVAGAADWPAIYPIFRRIVDDGETYAYDPAWSSDEARAVWLEPAPGRTVIAVAGGTVVGSAKMGPNRPGAGAHVATASFMVDPDHRGHGTGRALATDAVDWARRSGYHSMQFNAVVQTNEAAVHLWQDLGFEIIGTVPEAFRHPSLGLVGLHVMYRTL
jgi:L-amino acid N-acyltransferase YncA